MASSIINSDDGQTSGITGLTTTAGDDGNLEIQSNGTTVAAVNGSGVAVTGTLSASGGYGAVSASSLTVNSNNISADNSLGFRNRIINGDMRIDQRNAGAAVTINTTSNTYTLDRWVSSGANTDGVFTVDQVTDVPTGQGFTNSTKITVTTADASIGADQLYLFGQFIEGTNTADLMWGSASAKTVSLSFWVNCSLTGTHSVAIKNSANDRSYVATYTVSSANTWEYKTITIPGDTTGTWLTDTGRGVSVRFNLGSGTDYNATANTWTAGNYWGVSGQAQLIGTLNATWYITGVQLEAGSVATPYERRPYGTELSLCERYYQGNYANGASSGQRVIFRGNPSSSTGNFYYWMSFATIMRATPTMNIGTPAYSNASSASWVNIQANGAEIVFNVSSGGGYAFLPWRAESEL